MILVRAGRRYLNIDMMIEAEDLVPEEGSADPPGTLLVVMYPGRPRKFTGDEAERIRRLLSKLDEDQRADIDPSGGDHDSVGRAVQPGTGNHHSAGAQHVEGA